MVAEVFVCPHCLEADPAIRFGVNRSGTQRLWCKTCRRAFTPKPRDRRLTPEKEEQITRALTERLSQRAIARTLKVSRDTIREVLKRGRNRRS